MKELDKREKVIEELRKQRNRFTLLSSGSRKILSRSKNHSSEQFTLNQTHKVGKHHLSKNSLDFNSTGPLDTNMSSNTVHERLFQEKSIMEQKRRNLVQKYKEEHLLHTQSNSRSRERLDRKKELLKLSRSATNLID
jgi:hypothetical protein